MVNFTYHVPTKIEFGKDKEKEIGAHIASYGYKKVLLCYGSERIKKDGLFNIVSESLKANGIEFVELGGIVSNPILSKVYEGIEVAKTNKVDAILAVGGGSVLDSVKSIAAGAATDIDVWDFFTFKNAITDALPIFDILTLAATGSEMNCGAVVTNEKTKQKYAIQSPVLYPKVSIMNPELMKSVSKDYLVYSAVDIIAHTIEGYFNATVQPHFQSRLVESIIQTVIETTEILIQNPDDYNARAQFAWASTQALNGLTTAGTAPFIYPNHMIEHSLSAIFNIAHGAGLAIVIPAWAKWYFKRNEEQFKRFAKIIFNTNSAEDGIEALKAWFKKVGAPVSLKDANIDENRIDEIAANAYEASKLWGLSDVYTKEAIAEILTLAK